MITCYQCTASNGKVGTFLSTGEKKDGRFVASSPIFSDYYELIKWLKIRGVAQRIEQRKETNLGA
jgi:hypothetical protein